MDTQVTLTIPETLYKKAKRLARTLNRNVSDVLVEAIQLDTVALGVEEDLIVEQEREAFLNLHPVLWEKYPGEYIAIRGGKMIDHDTDRSALFARIDQQYPDEFVLMRRVEAQPEIVYQFRSPRLIQAP
ncbi:MAG: hypothetical protein Fur0022_02200 [Anaerolineales bacterium]